MASYTGTTKTAEYIAVSTIETPQETNIKMLPGAAVDGLAPILDVSSSKGKKVNKMKKKKRCLFMCFSNMQFDNEEEKEKASVFLKSENRKLSMVMCCSNFHVGSELEFGPKMTAK